jgi:succinyl-CoA synthetase beta subunit/citryl-CoA synthetase large subunit
VARLLEDQALAVLSEAGIAVPRWDVAGSEPEAAEALERLGGDVILKALVPIGGRGKAGLVRRASDPSEARAVARDLLGRRLNGFPVQRLLVMEHVSIAEELFVSFTFDSECGGPVVVFSRGGGVEVERRVRDGAASLIRRPVDIWRGLQPFDARDIAVEAGFRGDVVVQLGEVLPRLYGVFRAQDACLVEINPLAMTDGRVCPVAAVIDVDDLALFRHPELSAIVTDEAGTGLRPFTPLERRMREIDRADPDVGALRFVEFPDGDIGCLVTSGGASLTALGQLVTLGGRPANAFDITPGPNEEKIYLATRALLERGVRGVIAGGNVKNFTRVDTHVRAIVRAVRDAGVDPRRFPVVLRFAGPGIEAAREVARTVPGLELYEDDVSLEDAATRILELTRQEGRDEHPRPR